MGVIDQRLEGGSDLAGVVMFWSRIGAPGVPAGVPLPVEDALYRR